jgi:hypothetical protein
MAVMLDSSNPVEISDKKNSIISVKITNGFGFAMKVVIQRQKEKESIIYNADVNFFEDDNQKDLLSLNPKIFSDILEKYKYYINNQIKKVEENIVQSESKGKDSIVLHAIKDAEELTSMVDFLKDVRTMNVYTIADFSRKTIAKTTIELDADIVTLISSDILDNNLATSTLLSLHRCNVGLANQLFEYQQKKFFQILSNVVKMTRIAFLIPNGISFIHSLTSMSHGILQASPPVIITTILFPVLYWYVPNLLFRYTPTIIFRVASRIIGYLIKHKMLSFLQ